MEAVGFVRQAIGRWIEFAREGFLLSLTVRTRQVSMMVVIKNLCFEEFGLSHAIYSCGVDSVRR